MTVLAGTALAVSQLNGATITVTGTGDSIALDGVVTLREAITSINNGASVNADVVPVGAYGVNDRISFAIPGSGVQTIHPASALPTIINPVTIDGTSQPGFAGLPLIELDGVGTPAATDGLTLNAMGITVRGLIINDFPGNGITGGGLIVGNFIGTDALGATAKPNGGHGISGGGTIGGSTVADRNVISGNGGYGISGCNVIQGNFIGTDRTGLAALGNTLGGVLCGPGGGALIGGSVSSPGTPPGNVISGNLAAGVQMFAFSGADTGQATILGNLIGTDVTGTAPLGNAGDGILSSGSHHSIIGESLPGWRNIISGNLGSGVHLSINGLETTFDTLVLGNFIGTDISGTSAIGNALDGLLIEEAFLNTIGGSQPGEGNLISGNSGNGIHIQTTNRGDSGLNRIIGNRIGTDKSGASPLGNGLAGVLIHFGSDNSVGEPWAGNTIAFNGGAGVETDFAFDNSIRGNSIVSNTGLGIDNGAGQVNTPCGGAAFQSFPVLSSASAGLNQTRITGSLNSIPSTPFMVDFYASGACDPSGYGEGQRYLGSTLVLTDGSCVATFAAVVPSGTQPGDVVTATAASVVNNTSEFSLCLPVDGMQFFAVTPCRVADTRNAAGPSGSPALAANADRTFVIGGQCGIPSDALAVAFNFTATQPTAQGNLVVSPEGASVSSLSTIYYRANQTRANNAVLALGAAGDVTVHVNQPSGTVQLIIDVNGYLQ